MIDRVQFSTGAASGAAGSATASGTSAPAAGEVLAVHVAYLDAPPATADFTLGDEDDPAGEAIVSLVNANSDVKLYPRRAVVTNANAALLYSAGNPVAAPYAVHGRLTASLAQANAGDSVTVTVWLRR